MQLIEHCIIDTSIWNINIFPSSRSIDMYIFSFNISLLVNLLLCATYQASHFCICLITYDTVLWSHQPYYIKKRIMTSITSIFKIFQKAWHSSYIIITWKCRIICSNRFWKYWYVEQIVDDNQNWIIFDPHTTHLQWLQNFLDLYFDEIFVLNMKSRNGS